jgi:hypothetical protein
VFGAQPILSLLLVAVLTLVLLARGFTFIYQVVVSLCHNCLSISVEVVILDPNAKLGALGELHVPKTESILAQLG